jgi:drug/metabolite transporter (DMT)-like permease
MTSSPSPRYITLMLSLLAGVSAVSTAAIFIRFAQNGGAPSIVIAAARLTFTSLILAPVVFLRYRHDILRLNRKDLMLALLSGFFLALHFATWITSLEFTTVASSVVLVTTTPLWVAIIAPLVLHERLKGIAVLGLVFAMIGGIIVGMSDACAWQRYRLICPPIKTLFNGTAFFGNALALIGAWMAAGYLLVGKKIRARMELVPYLFIVYGMAALVLLVIMVGMGQSFLGLPPLDYLWFLLLALIPQLFGHSIFNWSLKFLPASIVALTLLGEPVGSTILAFVIFSEKPGWGKIFGALFILGGIWLAAQQGGKKGNL